MKAHAFIAAMALAAPPEAREPSDAKAIAAGDRVIHRGVAYIVRKREGDRLELEAESASATVRDCITDAHLVVSAVRAGGAA